MKTIAFNRQGGMFRTLFVIAALGGLYFYRRQGGSVSNLLAKGTQGLSSARGWVGGSTAGMGQRSMGTGSVTSSATI